MFHQRPPKNKEITATKLEEILDLYLNKNASVAEVSRQLNLAEANIRKILKANNIPLRGRRQKKKLTPTEVRRLLLLYENTAVTMANITRLFGITTEDIIKHVKENNITLRSKRAKLHYESRFKKNRGSASD